MLSTTTKYTYGVPCELGFGYDDGLERFFEFKANPMKVMLVAHYTTLVHVHRFSCTKPYITNFGRLLDESSEPVLDFHIINDNVEYYRFVLTVTNRKKTTNGFQKLPQNTPYYVHELYFGNRLDVILAADGFPKDTNEMETLIKSALDDVTKLNEIQKAAECRVLIDGLPTQMTLKGVVDYKNEFMAEQHREEDIVVIAGIIRIKKDLPIKNAADFKYFLNFVYTCYRKIEIKLVDVGYPDLETATEYEESIVPIIQNLMKAKENYKKMNKDDFFDVYRVLKTLFTTYIHYLKCASDHRLSIHEGADLPGQWQEMEPLLIKLNDWMPFKIGENWYGRSNKMTLVAPPGFDNVTEKLRSLNLGIDTEENHFLTEPHLFHRQKINGFFGFMDMSDALPCEATPKPDTDLELKCPQKCSDDERKWICQTCGDFVKLGKASIYCSCGEKFIDKNMFICHHPKHRAVFKIKEHIPW